MSGNGYNFDPDLESSLLELDPTVADALADPELDKPA